MQAQLTWQLTEGFEERTRTWWLIFIANQLPQTASCILKVKYLWQINIFHAQHEREVGKSTDGQQSNKFSKSFFCCSCLFICFVIIHWWLSLSLCLLFHPLRLLAARLKTCFTFLKRFDFSQRCFCYKEIVDLISFISKAWTLKFIDAQVVERSLRTFNT